MDANECVELRIEVRASPETNDHEVRLFTDLTPPVQQQRLESPPLRQTYNALPLRRVDLLVFACRSAANSSVESYRS